MEIIIFESIEGCENVMDLGVIALMKILLEVVDLRLKKQALRDPKFVVVIM